MPPISCERAVFGLMIRPTSNTPSRRGTRTSPVSACTRTSANWAPKLCIANRSAYGLSGISAVTSRPLGGHRAAVLGPARARSSPAAATIAEPQQLMPDEKPALDARRQRGVTDPQVDVLDGDVRARRRRSG